MKMSAAMEQIRAGLEGGGPKLELSELELFTLANLSHLGVLCIFAHMDGPHQEESRAALHGFLFSADRQLGANGSGLLRLCRGGAALLKEGRLAHYVLPDKE